MHKGNKSREIEGKAADIMAGGGGDNEKKQKSSKRTRTEIPSSSSSEVFNFSLNHLQASLIEEILCRLPNSKSVFQCKCVCKNWYSLVSSPYFVRRFITHHFNHHYSQNPSALTISYMSKNLHRGMFTVTDEPMYKSGVFDLNYIPHVKRSKVLAIFKDLILCSVDSKKGILRCCICNPFTMQWLPLPLLEHHELSIHNKIGFVCEPYYVGDSQGECILSCNYRFRVVHITKVPTSLANKRLTMWTYCSETQKWCRSALEGSEYEWYTDIITYNGKLLWYNGRSIFAYDPFNPELSTFIDCSYIHSTRFLGFSSFCIGLCKGFLRMMQFTVIVWNTRLSLAIWELKNVLTGEWRLEDKVCLDTMIHESPAIHEIIGDNENNLRLLGFHPSDGDIVYLHSNACVISCNTRKRELKMVGEIPSDGHFYRSDNVFQIEIPLWPTPIPKLIEIPPR